MNKSKLVSVCSTQRGAFGDFYRPFSYKGSSKSEQSQVEVTMPTFPQNLLYYEHFSSGAASSSNRLSFIMVGGDDKGQVHHDFSEYSSSVTSVDFSHQLGSVAAAFHVVGQLPSCSDVRFHLSNANIDISPTDNWLSAGGGTNNATAKFPSKRVRYLKIVADGGIKEEKWEEKRTRVEEILKYAKANWPNLQVVKIQLSCPLLSTRNKYVQVIEEFLDSRRGGGGRGVGGGGCGSFQKFGAHRTSIQEGVVRCEPFNNPKVRKPNNNNNNISPPRQQPQSPSPFAPTITGGVVGLDPRVHHQFLQSANPSGEGLLLRPTTTFNIFQRNPQALEDPRRPAPPKATLGTSLAAPQPSSPESTTTQKIKEENDTNIIRTTTTPNHPKQQHNFVIKMEKQVDEADVVVAARRTEEVDDDEVVILEPPPKRQRNPPPLIVISDSEDDDDDKKTVVLEQSPSSTPPAAPSADSARPLLSSSSSASCQSTTISSSTFFPTSPVRYYRPESPTPSTPSPLRSNSKSKDWETSSEGEEEENTPHGSSLPRRRRRYPAQPRPHHRFQKLLCHSPPPRTTSFDLTPANNNANLDKLPFNVGEIRNIIKEVNANQNKISQRQINNNNPGHSSSSCSFLEGVDYYRRRPIN